MKMYEVELRALLTEEQYNSLHKHFDSVAKGQKNDTETWAFLTKDVNIKVKNMIDQKKAKITLKNGAEFRQQANEYELPIDPKDVKKAVDFISALGFTKYIPSLQKRIDYQVGELVVSLKDEVYWRHHIEVELIVKNKKDIPVAKKKLHDFLKKFQLKPMTEEEARALTNKALKTVGIKTI